MEEIDQILEKSGYESKAEYKTTNIKSKIMGMLKNSKMGKTTSIEEMSIIRSNLADCDHFDLVRLDNLLARIKNQYEKDYQWGSVVLNKKWKIQ